MQKNTNGVEIQGPPIDEIQKRSSCLKQGCISTLFFLLGIILFFVFLIHFFVKPHSQKLDDVPRSFPEKIPLYDEENIDSITYIPGEERAETVELLAFIPKAILSPLIVALESAEMAAGANTENLWESFIRILGTSISEHRSIVSIEWSELNASPRFIYAYHKTSLEQAGFSESTTSQINRSRFSHSDGTTVLLEIIDDGREKNGTDYAILHAYYPKT